MVGKIKRVRHTLHRDAVRLRSLTGDREEREEPCGEPRWAAGGGWAPNQDLNRDPNQAPGGTPQAVAGPPFPSGVFAGTTITAEALVQSLKFEETPDVAAAVRKEPEEKNRSKKEKMKERRARWLSKMGHIIQTKERQRAEAQRRATPVVGDMRPLADALPELGRLIAPAAAAPAARRKSRKTKPVKRATPTDFSQMKPAHKRKLLEAESSLFSDSLKTLSTKTNPLMDIGEQLRKRMRQEEERRPS
ncbi:unnamed protein product [Ophioblennius macclurei]